MHWYDKTANSMKIVTKYSRQKMISILREDTSVLNDGSYQWAVEEGIVVFIKLYFFWIAGIISVILFLRGC